MRHGRGTRFPALYAAAGLGYTARQVAAWLFRFLATGISMSATKDDVITIVSGLPRSGTSMMMQMLHRGGIPAVTDEIRSADEDNPKGYYEFEPVKKTKEDASWLARAGGKVVKMVYRLLYDLPGDYAYHVVFMRRNLREVIASQNV